ncbi:voltage-gated potassium channel [Rhodoligotrophos appendicifer]|uniref:potassium channel family protein n=1 Tax=Rhodoligotrophos appendicifer TaxID=987056 RepID=UPI0011864224|nr:potassium channel family protein [Rhodoligotrophos appendicifer]
MPTDTGLRAKLRDLYFGHSTSARRFRYGLVVFDIVTIIVFLIAASTQNQWWLIPLDFIVGTLLAIEFAARLYAETNWRRHLFSVATVTDVAVIVSLFLPAFIDNLGFLRIIRALRLLRSYHLLRDLRSDSVWFRRYEDVIQRTINLWVFIFIVTSFVYVTQHNINTQVSTYIDALYFTITTLTTTGFGDITLIGPAGRLLAVIIMVVGVALFLRLLQALFRPNKVRFECPDCALQIHDRDAVHCKHCGRVLAIPNDGFN